MVQSLPLFGSPLVTALARSSFTTPSGLSIPGILARCFHEIEDKGLDIEGIFRKSGSTAAVNQLQAQFEENKNPFLVKFPSTVSTHSLAGLFKRYLQQLPEPVIPRQYQSQFLDIFDEEKCTKETLKRRLKEVCKTLPHEHLHLLQFLMEVVDMIQKHQEKNQMSTESLAIIFAPTCVGIDGVSKLMPSSSTTMYSPSSTNNSSKCSSYTSLPVMLNKQQLFRKARKLIWNTLRKKASSQDRISYNNTSLLYKPNELLQLELVKESNTWIRIFEFMMSYPEVFTTLTNPLKSQKYHQRPISLKSNVVVVEKKLPLPLPPAAKLESPTITKLKKSEALWNTTTPFTQQEKKTLIDFKSLEFTESHDLIKTFGTFDLNFDHILAPQTNNKKKTCRKPSSRTPSNSSDIVVTTTTTQPPPPSSKYVETLQNWKSREEENPNVIIPQEVVVIKRQQSSNIPTSPQPSDWVKALSGGMFEPNEKKAVATRFQYAGGNGNINNNNIEKITTTAAARISK